MLFKLNSVVIIKEDEEMYILCLPDNSTPLFGMFRRASRTTDKADL